MTWHELIWLPPLMLAIALVLGATGDHRGQGGLGRSIWRTFVGFTMGVVAVGVIVHFVAVAFAG